MIRARERRIAGAAIAAAALVSGGCVGVHRAKVDDYFPLAVGDEWTYEQMDAHGRRAETVRIVSTSVGDRGETRFALEGPSARYYVRDRVHDVLAIAVAPGIWTVLLQGPLELGTRFLGGLTTNEGFTVNGESDPDLPAQRADQPMLPIRAEGYKIVTSFERSVTVPAGTFPRCVEVSHVAGTVVGVKYFAPHVGLVLSEAWVEDRFHGTRSMIARQALTSYRLSAPDAEGKGKAGNSP